MVVVHEAGTQDGISYLVLDTVDGISLREALVTLPEASVLELLEQAARGLHAAHEVGVLHRDVKPDNVLVEKDGHARLVDFGLAKITDASVDLTVSGTAVGTPAYMSPEAARGERAAIGPSSDVYSLGAILYEALTGAPPYADARSVLALAARVTSAAPVPRASKQRAGIPRPRRPLRPGAREGPGQEDGSAREFADALALARGGGRRGRGVSSAALAILVVVSLGLLGVIARSGVGPSRCAGGSHARRRRAPADLVAKDGYSVPVSQTSAAEHGQGVAATRRGDGSFAAAVTRRPDGLDVVLAGIARRGRRAALRAAPCRGLVPGPPRDRRPRLPLPPGLSFGAKPGEYVNARDGSVLVFVPPGRFSWARTRATRDERPVHEVHLEAYLPSGNTGSRASRFAAFVDATSHVTTAEEQGGGLVMNPAGLRMVAASCWRYPEGDGRPPAPTSPSRRSRGTTRAITSRGRARPPDRGSIGRAAAWDPIARRSRLYSWGDVTPSATSPRVGNLTDEAYLRTSREPRSSRATTTAT